MTTRDKESESLAVFRRLSAHLNQLVGKWRIDAVVAGQFSVEGDDGDDQKLAAGQAMARSACADELEPFVEAVAGLLASPQETKDDDLTRAGETVRSDGSLTASTNRVISR